MIEAAQWREFEENGYVNLGKLLSDDELEALQTRIDDIMLGRAPVDYDRLLMQLDSTTGKYGDAGEQSLGFKGSTLAYRKIQNLELDDLFGSFLARDVFREICARVYGPDAPIACFRAMFMNKPSHQGTKLPWHQDAWTDLDRQPLITLWTALDPATRENGCVEVIPGSHKSGLVNPEDGSGFLTEEQATALCTPEKTVYLELQPGEVALLYNWLLHSSDVNRTPVSRRAFSVCYMDANTVSRSGQRFTQVFEPVAV
jgi:phytanoyl-CoA hydroxylase